MMSDLAILTVKFGKGGNAFSSRREGWADDEDGFVWSVGDSSRLDVPIPHGIRSARLEFTVNPHLSPPALSRQRLAIRVNGEELGQFSISKANRIGCSIPNRLVDNRTDIEIILEHPDSASPAEYGRSTDTRRLAIAFREMQLTTSSDYFVPPDSMLIDGSTSAEEFRRAGEGFVRAYLLERARLRPHERVLDLGCGNGGKARALASYLDHRGSYVGLDIVRPAVMWCSERYSIFPNFSFHVADVHSTHYNPTGRLRDSEYKFPFSDAEFDVVFLCSVFTHMLPDGVANYVAEIGRVLKPGGRCVATAFLLNDESITAIAEGRTSRRFTHQIGSCRVLDSGNPSMAVALDEAWMRKQFAMAKMRTIEMNFGMWRISADLKIASHDVLIVQKPQMETMPVP
jgi:SAM-dependent methyltransferase